MSISKFKNPPPPKEELEKWCSNSLVSCLTIANHYKVSQKILWRWSKNYGIKKNPIIQSKKINRNWGGNKVSYAAFHYRIESERGKPSLCNLCLTTESKQFEWANIYGNYADINDYIRMCVKCHRNFDRRKTDHINRSKLGRIGKYDLNWNLIEIYESFFQLKIKNPQYGYAVNLYTAIKNPNRTAYGFKWKSNI